MKISYLIYSTDAWHSNESKTLIGFYSDKRRIIGCINRYLNQNKLPPISGEYETVDYLITKKQTQGLEVNFIIDTLTPNTDTF